MIKALFFDMDGVLAKCVLLHYVALHMAITDVAGPEYAIKDEDIDRFNGLPTRTKLAMLTESYGLPQNLHKDIEALKQKYTLDMVDQSVQYSEELSQTMKNLKKDGYITACVSNSIPESMTKILYRLGVMNYLDFIVSNKTTIFNKPSPAPYLWALSRANVSPWESLCFEDSDKGMQSVIRAGCNLCKVDNPDQLTEKFIRDSIALYDA